MILLIDIGNTRIKWATLEAQRIGELHALAYAGYGALRIQEEVLRQVPRPDRILAANVAGGGSANILVAAAAAEWGVDVEFITSSAAAAGLRNGYAVPEKLGVDRWLGAIAAYHSERRGVCVASVGTAMTIDGVDATGQHVGGAIVPGPDLMIASLLQSTSDIASNARGGSEGATLFADNTLAAVHQGTMYALAALIERAMQALQTRIGETPTLLLTGGASGRIQPALRVPYRSVPDLVLQGLAVLART